MKAILCSLAVLGGASLFAMTTSASPAAPAGLCGGDVVGDYDNSGTVGVGDLVLFNGYYNSGDLLADLNRNCSVDVGDVVIMYDYAYPSGVSTVVDFNFDGVIDIADPSAYGSAYSNGDSRCDMNGDCAVDIADFSLWMQAFTACY